MTESEFFTAVVESLAVIQACCQVMALTLGFTSGGLFFKYLLYVKNHRDFW
jgi:hypothetical protein